jgi:hypothetical protein
MKGKRRVFHSQRGQGHVSDKPGGGVVMTEKPIFPLFIFERRSHVEREAGFILAGQLIVDIPNRKKPKRREQRLVTEIVQRLTAAAQSGQMPDDALIYGWPGGCRPAKAVDVDDDALMASWAKDRAVIGVRVDPRTDDYLRIDSDMALQMGLVKRH